MQVSRNDDEQSIHLKTSFKASEEKIDQQTEHFNDFNRILLKNEHRVRVLTYKTRDLT
jgi:hypothetical protein